MKIIKKNKNLKEARSIRSVLKKKKKLLSLPLKCCHVTLSLFTDNLIAFSGTHFNARKLI